MNLYEVTWKSSLSPQTMLQEIINRFINTRQHWNIGEGEDKWKFKKNSKSCRAYQDLLKSWGKISSQILTSRGQVNLLMFYTLSSQSLISFFSLDFVTTVMERPVLESLLEAITETVEWESHTMLTFQVRMNKENAF